MHNLLQDETARVLILIPNDILPSSPYTTLFGALQNFFADVFANVLFQMSLCEYGAYISLPYNDTGITNESNGSDIRSTTVLRFLAFLKGELRTLFQSYFKCLIIKYIH